MLKNLKEILLSLNLLLPPLFSTSTGFGVNLEYEKKVQGSKSSQIERLLDSTDAKILNLLALKVDDYLKCLYPQMERMDRYKAYIQLEATNSRHKKCAELRKEISESDLGGLFPAFQAVFPSSVRVEGGFARIKYPDLDIEQQQVLSGNLMRVPSDSIVEYYLNEPRLIVTEEGSIYVAITTLGRNDEFLKAYANTMMHGGTMGIALCQLALDKDVIRSADLILPRILAYEILKCRYM